MQFEISEKNLIMLNLFSQLITWPNIVVLWFVILGIFCYFCEMLFK